MGINDERLQAALALARAGFPVFPLGRGSKRPWISKDDGGEGLHDATTSALQINRWWGPNGRTPGANIGLTTGTSTLLGWERPDGKYLIVIDLDQTDGKDGERSWTELLDLHGGYPDTLEARTARGGRHLYFVTEERFGNGSNVSIPAPHKGIDVRGQGGYVVAPPSTTSDGAYEWIELIGFGEIEPAPLPEWLAAYMRVTEVERAERHDKVMRSLSDEIFGRQAPMPDSYYARYRDLADPRALFIQTGAKLHSYGVDPAGGTYEFWTRPGKDPADGFSATFDYMGSGSLHVFSSSWPGLTAEQNYDAADYLIHGVYGGGKDSKSRAQEEMQRVVAAADATAPAHDPTSATAIMSPGPGGGGKEPPTSIDDVVEATDGWRKPRLVVSGSGSEVRSAITDVWDEVNDPACRSPQRDGSPLMYSYGEALVRLDDRSDGVGMSLGLVGVSELRTDLEDWLELLVEKKEGDVKIQVPYNLSDRLVRDLLAQRRPMTRYRISGMWTTPYLGPDLVLRCRRGWDPTTLGFLSRDFEALNIPEVPTVAEVNAAISLYLDDVLCDVVFEDSANRANYMAMLLSPIIRASLPVGSNAQGFAITATESGSGKGLLVKVFSMILLGMTQASSGMPDTEVEVEKKLTSVLVADGKRIVIFDNVSKPIASDAIERLLTDDFFSGRLLYQTGETAVPNTATLVFTGNNINFKNKDLRRRLCYVMLYAGVEDPAARQNFKHPELVEWVQEHRMELLRALLILVQNWIAKGAPMGDTKGYALGNMRRWADTLMGIFEACSGVEYVEHRFTEFLGNEAAKNDRSVDEGSLGGWFRNMMLRFEDEGFRARDGADTMNRGQSEARDIAHGTRTAGGAGIPILGKPTDLDLWESLPPELGGGNLNRPLSSVGLGRWLAQHTLTIRDGLQLVKHPSSLTKHKGEGERYMIVRVDGSAEVQEQGPSSSPAQSIEAEPTGAGQVPDQPLDSDPRLDNW